MLRTGYVQKAWINRFSNYGAYVSDQINGEHEVLLPNKFVTDKMEVDQEVTVFIYRDSEKRLTATTQTPMLQVGKIASLKVVSKVPAGYFFNMGLDKDVFLPYNEAKGALQINHDYLVILMRDEEDQLYVSMKIYDYLDTNKAYKVNDQVDGIVYDIRPEMGAFVAVDDMFHGFVPQHEMYQEVKRGARINFRVTKVREDGKLNLSLKQKAAVQIFEDSDVILKVLSEHNGLMPYNDETDPEVIKKVFNLSKRAFKRGVGRLLKEGQIEILEDGIKKL